MEKTKLVITIFDIIYKLLIDETHQNTYIFVPVARLKHHKAQRL